ncbi:MAG: ADP-ribosylglycohydrolase family protein [Candidatus Bathyarchaeia archaeon]
MSGEMLRHKFVGCMVGCAVGDALGASFGVFHGRWTDDTHMMIGVAESLIANKGFNGEHMAQTFIKNYELEPWRGYASGPPQVFRWIKAGVPWNEAAKRLFDGMGSYGNGAAMRVAPVGLLYHDDFEKLRSVASAQSIITHAHELGVEGAVLQAFAVALAVRENPSKGLDAHAFLERLSTLTTGTVYKEKLEAALSLLDEKPDRRKIVEKLGNSVEAYNSVPTAIYCFLRNHESFKDAVEYAVSLGGDRDTIAAMTGAISGAFHNVTAIPKSWLNKLEKRAHIERLAEELWRLKRQDCF